MYLDFQSCLQASVCLMKEVPDDEFLFSLNLRLVDKFKSNKTLNSEN